MLRPLVYVQHKKHIDGGDTKHEDVDSNMTAAQSWEHTQFASLHSEELIRYQKNEVCEEEKKRRYQLELSIDITSLVPCLAVGKARIWWSHVV